MLKISPRGLETTDTLYPLSSTVNTMGLVAAQDSDGKDVGQLSQGDHRIKKLRSMVKDWTPENKSGQRFIRRVTDFVEKGMGGVPDFDSGYFNVVPGYKVYTVDHGLNSVPTRSALFLTVQDKAPDAPDLVFAVSPGWDHLAPAGGATVSSGIILMHQVDGQKSYVQTANDYLYNQVYTEGNLRVLLWR